MSKKHFSSILNEPAAAQVPATSSSPPLRKPAGGGRPTNTPKGKKAVSLHSDDDLVQSLDRLVFWRGRASSMREVLNDALRFYAAANPDSGRPMPGE